MAEETPGPESTARWRRSIRLRGFDYSQPGAYFVTICTQGRACILSEVVEGEVYLSPLGEVATKIWLALPARIPEAALDLFVMMPNHLHGIVVLGEFVGAGLAPPEGRAGAASRAPTLSAVVGTFKSISTIETNHMLGRVGQRLWQRGFYDRVIRNDDELARVRQYIQDNPAVRESRVDDH